MIEDAYPSTSLAYDEAAFPDKVNPYGLGAAVRAVHEAVACGLADSDAIQAAVDEWRIAYASNGGNLHLSMRRSMVVALEHYIARSAA